MEEFLRICLALDLPLSVAALILLWDLKQDHLDLIDRVRSLERSRDRQK